jgi:Ca-activated chloride channel family protein
MRRLILVLLAMLVPAALAAEPDLRVTITKPTWRDIVAGPSEIRVRLAGEESADVVEVRITVDDQLVATLAAPPYTVVHDFGRDLGAHQVRVAARTRDGRTFSADVTTRKFLANQVEEVALVNLFATVRDRERKIVHDLDRTDFAIFEDGVRQELLRFTDERRPLAVALVVDTSLTMARGEKLKTAQSAAVKFLEALQPGDRVIVVGFSDKPRVLQPLDSDIGAAVESLEGLEARGGTALYDAVHTAAEALSAVPTQERKVLVLLSDGRDEAASGLEPGSFYTFEEAREQVLQHEVIVFAVGLGRNLDQQYDFYGRHTLAEILRGLADHTGGESYFVKRAGQLGRAYDLIGQTLRYQYSLAYRSDNERRDGAWREVRVLVRSPEHDVTTRKGYYAN